ncbi:CBASS oligonucleotide cyclase [Nocardioides sp. YJ-D4]
MHEQISHKDLSAFAVAKVNIDTNTARARREQVAHLRRRLESYIAEHPDYNLVKMRGSGSVAKHTAIKSSSDTDVAAYVRASAVGGVNADETELLEWLRDRCMEVYGATKDASDFEISHHAVGITMHGTGLKIDVAPVLYEGEPDDRGYLVTRTGDRVLTSVTLHKEFLNKRRALAGPEYKQFIRLVKAFVHRAKVQAAASGPELRFKSFLVELIVAHLWDNGWLGKPFAITDYPRAFEQFLAYIVMTELKERIVFSDYYPASDIGTSYDAVQVWDPVNPENNVTRGYTDYDRQRLVQRCSDALDQVSIASAATSKTAAVSAWKTLFGPTFPGV